MRVHVHTKMTGGQCGYKNNAGYSRCTFHSIYHVHWGGQIYTNPVDQLSDGMIERLIDDTWLDLVDNTPAEDRAKISVIAWKEKK